MASLLVAFSFSYPFVKVVGQTMLDVTDNEKSNVLVDFFSKNFKGVWKLEWWEALICIGIPTLCTMYVHGHHVRILISWLMSGNKKVPREIYSDDSKEVELEHLLSEKDEI